jgi:hypothetical protein
MNGRHSNAAAAAWPPLGEWRDTRETLQRWTQIVGKTRLALSPPENHWWHIALYVTPRGLTTSSMPFDDRTFAVDFDFLTHRVEVRVDDGTSRAVPLVPQSVADFYGAYLEALRALGLEVPIRPVPVEVENAIPFPEDRTHAAYDADAAQRWWRALVQADRVLKRFRGRFIGKASPVHFFWGGFDLAATRFSGRSAPRHPGGVPNCPDYVMWDAYSHECTSAGFWPGGFGVDVPAFYAYAYPEPAGFAERPAGPEGAYYDTTLREFILPYEVVRRAPAPDAAVLAFLQAVYDAAADLGRWDRATLERPRG